MVEVSLLVFGLRDCILVVGGDLLWICWGISLLGSTHSVTLYGETSETGLCQIFAILGDGSMVQTFRCVRWCKQGVLSRNQFGSGGWKMKIEKFMTRMDTLGSWIWLVQTEISGSQKYINLRVCGKKQSPWVQNHPTKTHHGPRWSEMYCDFED